MLQIDQWLNKKFPLAPISQSDGFRLDVWARHALICYTMLYTTSTFFFPWMDQFWYVRSSVWFMQDIVYAVIAVAMFIVPGKKRPRVQEKKAEEKPKQE
jgi:hypothetical protein